MEYLSFLMNIIISTSLAPFLFTFPIYFRQNNTFLQVSCNILTYFEKIMTKTNALKVFIQTQDFTSYNRFEGNSPGIQI